MCDNVVGGFKKKKLPSFLLGIILQGSHYLYDFFSTQALVIGQHHDDNPIRAQLS